MSTVMKAGPTRVSFNISNSEKPNESLKANLVFTEINASSHKPGVVEHAGTLSSEGNANTDMPSAMVKITSSSKEVKLTG